MSDQPPDSADSPSRAQEKRSPSSVLERLRANVARGERYQSRDEIARGGMGAIVRVWDLELQRHLAMKVMLDASKDATSSVSAAASEGRRVARFLDEAHITGQLDHPGIVPVHEIGLDDHGRLFFTMRLIKGRELREVFELVHKGDPEWTLTRALGVILKVCEAMAFAHEKGVIHRDLKPANVMVGRFGEVYVMDWGLAKVLGREDLHDVRIAKPDVSQTIVRSARAGMDTTPESPLTTMDGDIVGTPCYMAPEQARGRLEDIGPQSDVYSVGSMLYELLSGEKPYCVQGEQPTPQAVLGALMHSPPRALTTIKKDIPEELIAICEKAMARDVRERYPSMLGMADDLRAFLEGRVVGAYEAGPIAEFKKWIARNRAFAIASAAALVITLAGVAAVLTQQHVANVNLQAANSVIEDRNRNLQDSERQTRSAYEQLRTATDEQDRVNRALQGMTAQMQTNAALAERRGYAANIAAAEGSLRFRDISGARRRLDECATELRGWEWQYLSAHCDDSVRTLVDEPRSIMAFAASRDGNVVAYALNKMDELSVHLLDGHSGQKLRDLAGHEAPIIALAFAPDGARIATAGVDRKVRVFNVQDGTLVTSWNERAGLAPCLSFTPDGKRLATACNDDVVRLREAETGAIVREVGKLQSRITSIALTPNGERLAAATREGLVTLFDVERGERIATLGHRETPIYALAFDSKGEHLITAGGHSREEPPPPGSPADHALRVWNSRTGELLGAWPGHDERVTWCKFDDGNRGLLSTSLDGTLRVIDLATGSAQTFLGHSGGIVDAELLGDARSLVTAGEDGTIRVWEPDLNDLLEQRGRRGAVEQLVFAHDGHCVIAAHADGLVRAHDTRTGLVRWLYAGSYSPGSFTGRTASRCLAASPTEDRVGLGGSDGVITLLSTTDGEVVTRWMVDESEAVTSLAFTPDGKHLAAGSSLGRIRVFELATNRLERTLRGAEHSVSTLAWSPDGKRLIAGASDGSIAAWNDAGESTEIAAGRAGGSAGTLAFDSASGRLLACSSGTLRLYDSASPSASTSPALAAVGRVAAEFLGDGRRFVACGSQGFVTIYDTERTEALLTLRGDTSDATALACAPGGREIAAGFSDGAIRLWSAAPLRERAEAHRTALRARDLALPLVDAMFTRGLTHEAALAELRDDVAISDALREAASSFLSQTHGKALFLRDESWALARVPGVSALDCQIALWQALAAQTLQADDYRAVFVEGAARHRLGQLERANARLKRSLELHANRRLEPEMAGFMVLNELALGHREAAQAPLAEFRSLMTVTINARSMENLALLQEVEEAVARAR